VRQAQRDAWGPSIRCDEGCERWPYMAVTSNKFDFHSAQSEAAAESRPYQTGSEWTEGTRTRPPRHGR
jgi:hypothetical protein